jgi:hypothetical protein
VNTPTAHQPPDSQWYEIRLQGHLEPRWATWFDGMTLTTEPDGSTALRGPVVDQSALHGVLARLRDLGVPLISLTQIPAHQRLSPQPPATPTDQK